MFNYFYPVPPEQLIEMWELGSPISEYDDKQNNTKNSRTTQKQLKSQISKQI